MKIHPFLAGVAAANVAALMVSSAAAQGRTEILPIQTVTLTTAQVLTGDVNAGRPTTIAGELRLPAGTSKVPAVILMHSSGGMGAGPMRWAEELNGIGVAALLVDSFSARGITTTVADQSQLDSLSMLIDAYRALGMLAGRSRIDPQRIAVMGFSKGAVAAVYSSNERFRKMYAPAGVGFAAHIGLYTPCNVVYRDDEKTTGAPLRLFHGMADDYVPAASCRTYVARLKSAGANVMLTEYEGAHHVFDVPGRPGAEPAQIAQAQTTRDCQLTEGDRGMIHNAKSGAPFTLADPCVERGPHAGYNEAAAVAVVKAVKAFLAETFGLTGPSR